MADDHCRIADVGCIRLVDDRCIPPAGVGCIRLAVADCRSGAVVGILHHFGWTVPRRSTDIFEAVDLRRIVDAGCTHPAAGSADRIHLVAVGCHIVVEVTTPVRIGQAALRCSTDIAEAVGFRRIADVDCIRRTAVDCIRVAAVGCRSDPRSLGGSVKESRRHCRSRRWTLRLSGVAAVDRRAVDVGESFRQKHR